MFFNKKNLLLLVIFSTILLPIKSFAIEYKDLSELSYFDYFPINSDSENKSQSPSLINPQPNTVFTSTLGGATGFLTIPVAFVNHGVSAGFQLEASLGPRDSSSSSSGGTDNSTEGTTRSVLITDKGELAISTSLSYGFNIVEVFFAYHQLGINVDKEYTGNQGMLNIGTKIQLYKTPESSLFGIATIINFYPYIGNGFNGESSGVAAQTLLAVSFQFKGLNISGIFGKSFGTYETNDAKTWDYGVGVSLRIFDYGYISLTGIIEFANYDSRGLNLNKNDSYNLNAIMQLGFSNNMVIFDVGVTRILNDSLNIVIRPTVNLYF